MALNLQPAAPWHWVVAVAALLAWGLLATRFALDRLRAFSPKLWVQRTIAIANTVVAGLLILAALNPVLSSHDPAAGPHLALVMDVSASVQRASQTWPEVRTMVQQRLQGLVDGIAESGRSQASCSITSCARGSRTVEDGAAIDELPLLFSRLDDGDFPPLAGSDLEAGLDGAAEMVGRAGGRGAVLLISDGHQTKGKALAAAARLAERGIAVHVLPLAGKSPDVGLYSADLPPNIEAEALSFARLFMVNRSARTGEAELQIAIDGDQGRPNQVTMPPGAHWVSLRQPVTFEDAGIRSMQLVLRAGGQVRLRRRFFTLVTAPPRLLAIGDAAWTRALPPGKFRVTAMAPDELNRALDPSRFDAVVISDVKARYLPPALPGRLAMAVTERGTGLLLVNGPHRGGPEAATTLMSYDPTPLEPLSPLINKPRPMQPVPPPRQVVILIDASGSMSGWPLEKEKQIALHIISQLRAVDRLDIIVFTSNAHHLIVDERATEDTKRRARQSLDTIIAEGGTDPSAALALVDDRRFTECGLFFLSDGYFERMALRPDCKATVFAIGHSQGSMPPVLSELAEPFPVGMGFNPANVRISFFKPKPRKNRHEPGAYRPLDAIEALMGGWTMLPRPPAYLDGNAVTHARDDAEVAAIRPRLSDPILAFREAGAGSFGVFSTAIPQAYIDRGRQTIVRWLERLLSFSARDRYAIAVRDRGRSCELKISLLAQQRQVPAVNRLSVRLEVPNGATSAVIMRPDPELAGVFTGTLAWPNVEAVVEGSLVISESGADALVKPQRIPFAVPRTAEPAAEQSDEDWCHGLNQALLLAIANRGGGRYDPVGGEPILHRIEASFSGVELRPALLVLAALLFLGQIVVRRLCA